MALSLSKSTTQRNSQQIVDDALVAADQYTGKEASRSEFVATDGSTRVLSEEEQLASRNNPVDGTTDNSYAGLLVEVAAGAPIVGLIDVQSPGVILPEKEAGDYSGLLLNIAESAPIVGQINVASPGVFPLNKELAEANQYAGLLMNVAATAPIVGPINIVSPGMMPIYTGPELPEYYEPAVTMQKGHEATIINQESTYGPWGDQARQRLRLYWTKVTEDLAQHYRYVEQKITDRGNLRVDDIPEAKELEFIPQERRVINFDTEQWIEEIIQINSRGASAPGTKKAAEFEDYINDLFEPGSGKKYQDLPFTIKTPTAKATDNGFELSAKYDPHYNFYHKGYEEIGKNYLETVLPNIYALVAWAKYTEKKFVPSKDKIDAPAIQGKNTSALGSISLPSQSDAPTMPEMMRIHQEHITLDNKVLQYLPGSAFKANAKKLDFTRDPYSLYISAWADAIKNLVTDEELKRLETFYRDTILPVSEYDTIAECISKIYQMPLHVKIDFSYDISKILQKLQEEKLDVSFLTDFILIEGLSKGIMSSPMAQYIAAALIPPETPQKFIEEHSDTIDGEYKNAIVAAERDVYDLEGWIALSLFEDPKKRTEAAILNNSVAVMGDGVFSLPEAGDDAKKSIADLNAYLAERTMDSVRGWWDVILGKKATREVLFYRVEKWLGQELIQTFSISAPQKTELFRYNMVDSEVKYGTKYVYKIYAYVLVFGSQYEYLEHIQMAPEKGYDRAQIRIKTTPRYWLIRLPYYNFDRSDIDSPFIAPQITTEIYDKPPVYPTMSFIPYRGQNDKVLINLVPNGGDLKAKPVLILPEDLWKFAKVAKAQGYYTGPELAPGTGLISIQTAIMRNAVLASTIQFAFDDIPSKFEVFRLKTAPETYADFHKGRITRLDYPLSSFMDTLQPNVSYYYMGRILGVHDEDVSNPSDIIEVKLNDREGMIWLDVKPFTFAKQQVYPAKTIQKYLYIRPALSQIVLPEPKPGMKATDIKTAPEIGVSERSIFDNDNKRRYRIKLTSRKTGRQVDLNVIFTKKHLVNETIEKGSPSTYSVG